MLFGKFCIRFSTLISFRPHSQGCSCMKLHMIGLKKSGFCFLKIIRPASKTAIVLQLYFSCNLDSRSRYVGIDQVLLEHYLKFQNMSLLAITILRQMNKQKLVQRKSLLLQRTLDITDLINNKSKCLTDRPLLEVKKVGISQKPYQARGNITGMASNRTDRTQSTRPAESESGKRDEAKQAGQATLSALESQKVRQKLQKIQKAKTRFLKNPAMSFKQNKAPNTMTLKQLNFNSDLNRVTNAARLAQLIKRQSWLKSL